MIVHLNLYRNLYGKITNLKRRKERTNIRAQIRSLNHTCITKWDNIQKPPSHKREKQRVLGARSTTIRRPSTHIKKKRNIKAHRRLVTFRETGCAVFECESGPRFDMLLSRGLRPWCHTGAVAIPDAGELEGDDHGGVRQPANETDEEGGEVQGIRAEEEGRGTGRGLKTRDERGKQRGEEKKWGLGDVLYERGREGVTQLLVTWEGEYANARISASNGKRKRIARRSQK